MKKFKKFKDFDEDYDVVERDDRRHKLSEKRLKRALKSRDIDALIDVEEDYI